MQRSDNPEIRFVEFLALLAGLVGVVLTLSPASFTLNGLEPNFIFTMSLIAFMFFAVLAYTSLLRGKESRYFVNYVIVYFSGLMAYGVATSVTDTYYALPTPPSIPVTDFFLIILAVSSFVFAIGITWRFGLSNPSRSTTA